MSMRVYQITAVAILLAAPIIVNVVSNVVPGAQPADTAAAPGAQPQGPATQPAASRPFTPPPPQSADGTLATASTAPAVDTTPAMDTQGSAPVSADGQAPYAPPPPPPSQSVVQQSAAPTFPSGETKGPPPPPHSYANRY